MELSGAPWYSVARNDVFPEEFATFLLGSSPAIKAAFLKYHRDLLDPGFWRAVLQRIRQGHIEDFFPSPEELRFSRRVAAGGGAS